MNYIKDFIKRHPSAWRYVSITALIALLFPTFFIGAYAGDGGKYFALSVYLLIAIVGSYEVLKNLNVSRWSAGILALVVAVIFFYPEKSFNLDALQTHGPIVDSGTTYPAVGIPQLIKMAINWKSILVIIVAPFLLFLDPKLGFSSRSVVQVLIGSITMLMISIFAKFVWIVNINDVAQLFYFLPIAIIADSFGYFGGKYLGKTLFDGKKLAPNLSPKKTWAGFVIGYIFSMIFVSVAGAEMGIFDSLGTSATAVLIVLSFILPAISAMGDLMFSGFKRYLGIKDFSNLMPGHGGIMDRLDAMSTVVFIIFITFLIVL